MSNYLRVILVVLIVAIALVVYQEAKQDVETIEEEEITIEEEVIVDEETEIPSLEAVTSDKGVTLYLSNPTREGTILSPLMITGEAPGYWFFEASFPVILTNWDGLIIAEGYATATEDWMTEELVPFTAELEFETPAYGENGFFILKRDNPSGLPENDDAVEIRVFFGAYEGY